MEMSANHLITLTLQYVSVFVRLLDHWQMYPADKYNTTDLTSTVTIKCICFIHVL